MNRACFPFFSPLVLTLFSLACFFLFFCIRFFLFFFILSQFSSNAGRRRPRLLSDFSFSFTSTRFEYLYFIISHPSVPFKHLSHSIYSQTPFTFFLTFFFFLFSCSLSDKYKVPKVSTSTNNKKKDQKIIFQTLEKKEANSKDLINETKCGNIEKRKNSFFNFYFL